MQFFKVMQCYVPNTLLMRSKCETLLLSDDNDVINIMWTCLIDYTVKQTTQALKTKYAYINEIIISKF
jgi:hypothetical protein